MVPSLEKRRNARPPADRSLAVSRNYTLSYTDYRHTSSECGVVPIEPRILEFGLCVSRSKPLRTASNMFIVSLAIFDIIMSFEMPMLVISSFMERMIGWEIGCDVYAVFGSISGMGQSITNAAIAFDRYRLRLFRLITIRLRST